jgi:hypothetical protein
LIASKQVAATNFARAKSPNRKNIPASNRGIFAKPITGTLRAGGTVRRNTDAVSPSAQKSKQTQSHQ